MNMNYKSLVLALVLVLQIFGQEASASLARGLKAKGLNAAKSAAAQQVAAAQPGSQTPSTP